MTRGYENLQSWSVNAVSPAYQKPYIIIRFNVLANKVKYAALQQLAKWFANHYHLKQMGRITELRFNSVAEEIFMVLDLHGEQTQIEQTVRYRVISPTLLEVAEVKSSRQWIAELINHMVPAEQKCFEVAPAVTRALTKLAE